MGPKNQHSDRKCFSFFRPRCGESAPNADSPAKEAGSFCPDVWQAWQPGGGTFAAARRARFDRFQNLIRALMTLVNWARSRGTPPRPKAGLPAKSPRISGRISKYLLGCQLVPSVTSS